MEDFQTLEEFLTAPFGKQNISDKSKFESMYTKLKSSIKIIGYMTTEDKYFIHISIPSETNSSKAYDVIIMFFTANPAVKKQLSLRNYFVSFFSNSPSFIFQYASLYKQYGCLIDVLFDKLDKDYSEVTPKNPKDLSYDKSIYCACRYLLDDKLISLSKMGILTKHKKSPDNFFKDIKSFSDIKITNDLSNFEKKIDKELDKNKSNNHKKPKINHLNNKIVPKNNTLGKNSKSSITKIKKISGKRVNKKIARKRP